LEGSTRMLGLGGWSETLIMFREFLEKTNVECSRWDENKSQVVSEILEAEEQIADSLSSEGFKDNWDTSLFDGVKKEIEALAEECEQDTQSGSSAENMESDKGVVYIETFPRKLEKVDFNAFEKLIGLFENLQQGFDSCIENSDRWEERAEDFELKFEESKFYINLVGDLIQEMSGRRDYPSAEISGSLLVSGIRSIVDIYSGMKGWEVSFHTNTDKFSMSGKSASAISKILENCLFDIISLPVLNSDDNLTIELNITCKGSYLEVIIRDNYTRYLNDSEIDHDDPVAFYKGLRVVRNILKDRGGLLWVEPGRGKEGRFKFTFPRTGNETDYYVFDVSGKEICISSYSMEGIYKFDTDKVILEGGRYYMKSLDKEIPVFGMSELASEEINPGDENNYIIVIGSAEERVGIFSKDYGYKLEGVAGQLVEEHWASISNYLLQIGDHDCAVLDIMLIFSRIEYLRGLEVAFDGSGSVAIDTI
ncbi:hypothetical protein J7M07_00885, partial [bacterium]|nr:hypothetical protein [bacterium]